VFDGQHLRIESVRNGPAFVVDVTFHPETYRWTGTWSREGQLHDVVLERPHPLPGVAPSPFKGDWEGLPDRTGLAARSRLHIGQSSDGALTVWMDRFMSLVDQRHGELLQLESVEHGTIMLDTTNSGGARYRYHATLSGDRSTLVGTWGDGTGGTLNASSSFRRMP
jgi:hypothetical protein